MKKLSLYVFLVLMFCNVGFAKPVLLECIEKEPLNTDVNSFTYWSLDLEKKNFIRKAMLNVAKICSLGNCEELIKFDDKIPYIKENAEFLYLGFENIQNKTGDDVFDYYTFNKKNLDLVNYYNNIYDEDLKKRYTYQSIYSCKKINKFPF